MQFVPTSTGQDNKFAKIQKYSFFTLTYLASTWEVMYFVEASIKVVSKFKNPSLEVLYHITYHSSNFDNISNNGDHRGKLII